MRSMYRVIDGPSIAAEVRMERQKHKGSFLLVEGATDMKRLERLIDENVCAFVNCFGKDNVLEAIEQIYDDGILGVLGMVDADFDRTLGRLVPHEGVVHSDTHDFDLDTATTTALERYLREVASEAKLVQFGGPRGLLEFLLDAIRPLSAMRFSNEKHQLGYVLKDLKIDEFFNGQRIDIDLMVESVSQGKLGRSENKNVLRNHIDRYASSNLDRLQLSCGHDFCYALGISLRNIAGDRRAPQTWRSEIEMHLRLAMDADHFRETEACSGIGQWEDENAPYRVLRN